MKLDRPVYLHGLWGTPAPQEVLSHPTRGWTFIGEYPVRPVGPEMAPSAQILLQKLFSEHFISPPAPVGAVYIGSARGEIGSLLSAYETWKVRREALRLVPETTPGALSALVAEKLACSGPAITLSQTCVSGLAALFQAILYTIATGQAACFGAVEAPLHPLLVESFGYLRLASRRKTFPYTMPFQENSVTLAEGVVIGFVSPEPGPWQIEQVALYTHRGGEMTFTALPEAAFPALLRMLGETPPQAVILHAPGTRKGDFTELRAIEAVWGRIPAITIKPLIGHSIGASGLLSLLWAQWLMTHQVWLFDAEGVRLRPPDWPGLPCQEGGGRVRAISPDMFLDRVAVLGAGFGGGVAGVILRYVPF